ncbi:hypothetical protein IV500_04185 [Paeniglutamicibacter antarcticus]|uniref:Uncharacterized protein n=2 Tax=Arthrobacter terrae TaxID=2935737 RepID=A0A931CNG7_9MICC|nr:hypothetical protein [Arthrobacter terrae]
MANDLVTAGRRDDPLEAIHSAIAFGGLDWSIGRETAWIYGITVGWGAGMSSVAARHGWSPEKVARLRRLRAKYRALERVEERRAAAARKGSQ